MANKKRELKVESDENSLECPKVGYSLIGNLVSKRKDYLKQYKSTMGNRVKGKTKKKSIKAASHAGMGSKRKLSRMGKKQKKDNAGLEATFIGRSKCLKMLQITIKDFRKLCILKGIYPREPRGRVPGNKKGQTFYHIKDIRALAHEPVLEKFREFRAFVKKVGTSMSSYVTILLTDLSKYNSLTI
jgi:hypothetical protein